MSTGVDRLYRCAHGTWLYGGSQSAQVVMESVSHVDQSEAESSILQVLSCSDSTKSSAHHHHVDTLG